MRQRISIVSPQVLELRRRLDRWRREHRAPTPIPADLWKAAVELAGEHGACGISRALRLSYRSLRKRLDATGAEAPSVGRTGAFVEFVPVAGASALTECLVELEAGDGARMRIQLKGARTPEIVALTTALWRGEG